MWKLYTIGYGNASLDDLARTLVRRGVQTVADVRWSPHGRMPGVELQKRLPRYGLRYVWAKELGNRLFGFEKKWWTSVYRDHLSRSPHLIAELLANEPPICLLCCEAQPDSCHRALLANWLDRERGYRVEHLYVEKAAPQEVTLFEEKG
jgi:ATP-dependent DNA helicase RecQ